MPAKPAWACNLDNVIAELDARPEPLIDRSVVEFILGVGRRRAQQILAPCVSNRVGANGLADKDALIVRLRQLAGGEEGQYEVQRRRKLAGILDGLRKQRLATPGLFVEAPARVVNQEFENLPPGVQLERGRITVEFEDPQQALEKLLALAMAVSNDFDRFERITRHQEVPHL